MSRAVRRAALLFSLSTLAVFAFGGASAGAATAPLPTANATNWTATVPTRPGAQAVLDDVSCTTATFCIGTGTEQGVDTSYIERWNGTSWAQVMSTPSSSATPTLDGVSCIGTAFCVAVGTLTTGDVLVEQWNGSAWTAANAPAPASSTATPLDGVSCLSATDCTAVGSADTGSGPTTLVEHWNGTSWSIVTSPNPSGSTNSSLKSVSCTSATSCTAVGSADTGSGPSTLVEQWDGTSWTIKSSPDPSGSTDSELNGVSCIGAAFCEAVGFSDATGTNQTLVESWNGSSWAIAASPNTSTSEENRLNSVDCFSMTTCSAVGFAATPTNTNGALALVWNGVSWSLATTPTSTAFPVSFGNGVSCLTDWQCVSVGSYNPSATPEPFVMTSSIARTGYRFVASDGGIFAYGSGAPFIGSLGGTHLNAPIVGMATMPGGDGYYLVASDGGVFNYGSAQFYGSAGSIHLNKPIVGMAVTADGGGYWLVASDGGIFSYGDAQFYGSTGAIKLDKPIVGMAPTPDGKGYDLVASDGGVFNFGAAQFEGSMGGMPLNQPVVGIADPVAGGYYLVASDGGIFSFPTTNGPPFEGSTGSIKLNKPIVGMTTAAGGYYLSGSDGGIFAFPNDSSGPPFLGSTGSIVLNQPIVGMSA